ncbi:MAG: metalloregulator ArsR/SmtB family transcription factor [Pseudomonadota bacterium]
MDALGNDVRRAILRMLAEGAMTASAIAAEFPISRPAISRHLKLLTDAKLIAFEPQGRQNLYHLAEDGFAAGRTWLDQFWPDALTRFRLLAENTYEAGGDA